MITLRDYQQAAVDATIAAWREGTGSALIVLPTGTGKSLVLAELIRRLAVANPDWRMLAVTHVRELIEQNAAALLRRWPEAPLGIYSAGLGRREGDARIVFGSIASLRDPSVIGKRHFVLIDEAHLVSHASETMYGRLLTALRQDVPRLRVAGLTATPYRLSTGRLTDAWDGTPPVFERVVYDAKLADMIAAGWLCPLTSKATPASFDLKGVKTRGGEFVAGDLDAAINVDLVNLAVVAQTARMAADRKSWLLFAVSHEHATALGGVLSEAGITNAVILGDTASAERDAAIGAFRAGRVRALVSVGVLTTGFDAPNVDCIVMARPTKSLGLYVQMLGRGMRLADGKRDCLVLDFAGNVSRLGPVDEIDGSESDGETFAERREDRARAKACPACHTLVGRHRGDCPSCGHQFPKAARAIGDGKLSGGAVMSSEADYKWFVVQGIRYMRHEKDGRATLRVLYDVPDLDWSISEFLSFDGNGRWALRRWWAKRAPHLAVPETIEAALVQCETLPKPALIFCRRDDKYWRVREIEFHARQSAA